MASEKVLDRVEKLLRLAAPSSNSTEHERASAALKAAELIEEHGLTFREPSKKSEHRATVARNVWILTVAIQYTSCSHCGGKISRADVVWRRVLPDLTIEHRHNCKPCRVE